MQAGNRKSPAGLDLAGNRRVIDGALGSQRDDGRGGIALVAFLVGA
jgi:hypothetical protein